MTAAGRWQRLRRGVYQIAGSASSWRQSLMAGVLACGDGTVVSRIAAAGIWSPPGLGEGPIEFTTTGQGRPRGLVVHRVDAVRPIDRTVVDGIPVTSPARTLIDIAAVVPVHVLEEVLDDFLRRNLVSLPLLRRRIAAVGRQGRPGIAAIRSLVASRDDDAAIPGSVFERRLLRLLMEHGLPAPELQYEIRVGNRRFLADFAYPAARLVIEAEGLRWHGGRAKFERDLARRNAITSLDWRMLHLTWRDLIDRPEEAVAAIRDAFTAGRSRGRLGSG